MMRSLSLQFSLICAGFTSMTLACSSGNSTATHTDASTGGAAGDAGGTAGSVSTVTNGGTAGTTTLANVTGGSNTTGGASAASTTPCVVTQPTDFANWSVSDSPNQFTFDGVSTITDNHTGLSWQRSLAQGGTYRHGAPVASCECPWRLPQRIELLSIVDYSRSGDPTPVIFGQTAQYLWTATQTPGANFGPWEVGFLTGESDIGDETVAYKVRCVSGSTNAPAVRYTVATSDAGVTEVLDNGTGLYWKQASEADTLNAGDASAQCNSIGYRLPLVSELRTLLDTSRNTSPLIDTSVFPDTASDWYWTATAYRSGNNSGTLPVDFSGQHFFGQYDWESANRNHVRCVR